MTRPYKGSAEPARKSRPATTPEGHENHLISLAQQLAEQQLLDGSASSQVMVHYLKLGTSRERREQRKLELEIELLRVKTEDIAASARIEELYGKALNAMSEYQGNEVSDDEL